MHRHPPPLAGARPADVSGFSTARTEAGGGDDPFGQGPERRFAPPSASSNLAAVLSTAAATTSARSSARYPLSQPPQFAPSAVPAAAAGPPSYPFPSSLNTGAGAIPATAPPNGYLYRRQEPLVPPLYSHQIFSAGPPAASSSSLPASSFSSPAQLRKAPSPSREAAPPPPVPAVPAAAAAAAVEIGRVYGAGAEEEQDRRAYYSGRRAPDSDDDSGDDIEGQQQQQQGFYSGRSSVGAGTLSSARGTGFSSSFGASNSEMQHRRGVAHPLPFSSSSLASSSSSSSSGALQNPYSTSSFYSSSVSMSSMLPVGAAIGSGVKARPKQHRGGDYDDDDDGNEDSSSSSSPVVLSKTAGYFTQLLARIPERWIPMLLFIFGLVTRFYRLDLPAGVVFDESHFGRFTGQYHAGTYLFDIHPPLGKLTFWFVGRAVTALLGHDYGYDHTQCSYASIAEGYSAQCRYMLLRATAAIFGAGLIPLIYLITRNWGASVLGGLLAAMLCQFDMLNLMESRYILMDSQLIFYICLSLYCAQVWWKKLNRHAAAEIDFFSRFGQEFNGSNAHHVATDPTRLMSWSQHAKWLVIMGVVCGLAVSVKHTGLATPGLIAIESCFGFWFLKKPVKLSHGVVIGLISFLVYAIWFYFHFALLPKSGDGDGFMSLEFQRTLIGNSNYDANASRPPFLVNFWNLNREMVSANARITQRHNWDSWWYEWILNLRGLLYFSRDSSHTYTNAIYLLGNPVVIWLVALCMAVTFSLLLLSFRFRKIGSLDISPLAPYYAALDKWRPLWTRLAVCSFGYLANLLPYVFVTRSCFIYHYIPALVYGEIATALLLDALAGKKWMPTVFRVVVGAAVVCFLFYAPWIYLFPLTNDGHARRRWLPRWN